MEISSVIHHCQIAAFLRYSHELIDVAIYCSPRYSAFALPKICGLTFSPRSPSGVVKGEEQNHRSTSKCGLDYVHFYPHLIAVLISMTLLFLCIGWSARPGIVDSHNGFLFGYNLKDT